MTRAKITMIVMVFMSVAIHLAKDGEKRDPYNAKAALFGLLITMPLYYYAGIFDL